MNLQSEITLVREKVGEPFRTDETNSYILDVEIIGWLNEGELQVMRDVVDDALYTQQKEATGALTTGSATLPTDFLRALSVQVQLITSGPYVDADLVSIKQVHNAAYSPNWRPAPSRPYCYIFQGTLYSLPDTAVNYKLRYVYEPTFRYKYFRGDKTDATSTTVIASTNMATLATSYWVGCELKLTSSPIKGESSTVTASTNATPPSITVSPAFSLTVPVATTFEVGQVSTLPGELYSLWTTWAAHLAFTKDRQVDMADREKAKYDQMVEKINGRYVHLLRQEPNREMPR